MTYEPTPRDHRSLRMPPTLLPAIVAALLGAMAFAPPAVAATRKVHLRGTAYEFNNVHTLLGGGTIHIAEYPRLKAIVRPDGTYDLAVPDGAKVTPYIRAAGHHTIYLQTFTTRGEGLANVNFQTPSEAVYRALVALLAVPVDAAGNPTACAIVSTFSTRNVRDLGFAGFTAYGAHGVAGATATAAPPLPAPAYFNENVVPDPAQKVSSKDGGVVWTGVPPGVYTIRAHHPTARFASFVATCRAGRIVNANPPWGLHELGLPNPARVAARWSIRGSRATLRSLTATRLPANARVRVRCSGSRCPFTSRTLTPPAGAKTADLLRALGGPGARQLRAGQTLEVAVSAHAHDGTVIRWRIAPGRTPSPAKLCVPLGDVKPRACA
ncbi:MAG: hypothetical protein ACXVFL_00880 [Solirubrobacteraceae bacterium]